MPPAVSVLFNEPKLLKSYAMVRPRTLSSVSVLFNEPKLLKFVCSLHSLFRVSSFSALQRAEIAEIEHLTLTPCIRYRFSALQRAEIAEILLAEGRHNCAKSFSALQRAEIAEMIRQAPR